MWNRVTFKQCGKRRFLANYWSCVGVSVLFTLLTGGLTTLIFRTNHVPSFYSTIWHFNPSDFSLSMFLSWLVTFLSVFAITSGLLKLILQLLVTNPYEVGSCRFFMENSTMDRVSFSTVKAGFSHNYGNIVFTQFLCSLFIVLWSFLFVIPGIICSYAYFAVPYILAENPNLDHSRVLQLSKAMTNGWKGELFFTDLSFLGWFILSSLTRRIVGIFYVDPYYQGTKAEIYQFLRQNALQSGIATHAELPGVGNAAAGPGWGPL